MLIDELGRLGGVRAIGIGGSRAAGTDTTGSDFDIYAFTTTAISHEARRALAKDFADVGPVEIGNQWWGDEDGYAINGVWHEIAYFSADWFLDDIDAVLHHHRASQGYSTSFVYTLNNMYPVFDPEGFISGAKAQVTEYPEELARAIIALNLPIVSTVHASYRNQIARAIELRDAVAVNHRVAGFLASVFDITFAALRQWHPGEKRQLQHLEQFQAELPPNFPEHILDVVQHTTPDRLENLLASVDRVATDAHNITQAFSQDS